MTLTVHKEYYALGTDINLTVFSPATEADVRAGYDLIKQYESLLTVNRDNSEVMSVNRNAGRHPVAVSSVTYQLVKRAIQVSLLNAGYNVAIGPIIKLWKIGFSGANKPAKEAIRQKLHLIDPKQIKLNDNQQTILLQQQGMELDLGGIAKGYIADAVARLWHERGVRQGIIDLGGNIVLVGPSDHADAQWQVGIQDPLKLRNKPLIILRTPAKSVVTSGIYERFLEIDGHRYHHLFDSQTGYPVANNVASVTIVSDQSIDGDIWTTLAFYPGLTAGLKLLEKEPSLGAIFVTQNKQVAVTSNLRNQVEWINPSYQQLI